MRARGHALMLLLTFLTVASIGFAVMASRVGAKISTHRPGEVRLQTLWLARSAVTAGITGKNEVSTAYGVAEVKVEKSKDATVLATVQLAEGSAEVSRGPSGGWLERYDQR